MSLRVLLADESDTIKKVFQLALQDLNAEVKSVHSGLDVIDVATSFKPNIIFADVLLQKKNGYDICLDIKQNSQLSAIPVVLMWSSFMELDQSQFKKSLANDQLEKPFDADLLREIVQKHTSALDNNPMAQFLNFPKTISTEEASTPISVGGLDLSIPGFNPSEIDTQEPALSESPIEENTSEFNLAAILGESDPNADSDSKAPRKSLFDDLAIDFPKSAATTSGSKEPWKEKDLSAFLITEDKSDDLDKFEALNLATSPDPSEADDEKTMDIITGLGTPEFSLDNDSSMDDVNLEPISLSQTVFPNTEQKNTAIFSEESKTPPPAKKSSTTVGLNDNEIEAIVRAHTEEVIKLQLKDSLMQIIERVVREELHRIVDEEVKLQQQDADIDS